MPKITAALLAIMLLGAPAIGPVDEAMTLLMSGKYLAGIDRLRAADKAGDERAASVLAQFEPTITGFPRRSSAASTGAHERPVGIESVLMKDALKEITRRARQTRIVIINEAHDTPRHRAFSLQVAELLRPLGYTYLAAETFTNDPSTMHRLKRDGFVRRSTGTYTIDPVFADFVRQSLRLGYVPIAYEEIGPGVNGTRAERIAAREEAQASSLARQIAAAGPTAKFLIHVGHGHIAEEPVEWDGTTQRWMAARLKQKTAVDPLTIEQTALDEFTPSHPDRAIYAWLASRLKQRSAIPTRDGQPLTFGHMQGKTDLQIVHPAMRLERGRPDWLRTMGRRPVPIRPELLPSSGCRLIQAFARNESEDAIPLDQVTACAGSPAPVLMLPHGPLRFSTQPSLARHGVSRRKRG